MILEVSGEGAVTGLIGGIPLAAVLFWFCKALLTQNKELLDELKEARNEMVKSRSVFLGKSTKQIVGLLVALLCVFGLSGCAGVGAENLKADVANFNAIAPTHADYLRADPKLEDIDKEFELNTLVLWRARLITLGGSPDAVDLELTPGEEEDGTRQANN